MKPNTPSRSRIFRLVLAVLSTLLLVSTLANPASAHDVGQDNQSNNGNNGNNGNGNGKGHSKSGNGNGHGHGNGNGHKDDPTGSATVISEDELAFMAISPFATFGSAQGDFTSGAHGTFGIFGAGAASPPHTHSGTYYGVVLSGEMNNPFGTEATPPTLAPGSFWSVPADEQHVTACLTPDNECRFFFHSASVFDFFALDELTDPQGDEAQSIPVGDLTFDSFVPFDGAATVWGDPASDRYGAIVRLDAGSETDDFVVENAVTVVPITGTLEVETADVEAVLAIGSLLEAEDDTALELECGDDGGTCLLYVFSEAGPLVLDQKSKRK